MKKITKCFVIITAACAAASASAGLVSIQSMDKQAEAIMASRSPNVSLMVSICKEESSLELLGALAKQNIKATVFVSGEALEKDSRLAPALRARRDLFEVQSLGMSCTSKGQLLAGVKSSYLSPVSLEGPAELKAAKDLASNMVKGSIAIFKATGALPRFFAFGLDFDSPQNDIFVESRMEAGLAEYLAKPTAKGRFNAFAASKAVFSNWVAMGKLDKGEPRKWDPKNLSVVLEKVKVSKLASESWLPYKRAENIEEIKFRVEQEKGSDQ